MARDAEFRANGGLDDKNEGMIIIGKSKITLEMMKKTILTIVAALTMAITPAMAQVFLDDGEWNDGRDPWAEGESGFGVMVAEQNVTYDQYIPVGEGLVLLTGLGLAYLVGKRKKDE